MYKYPGDPLDGWRPDPETIKMYGWVHTWLYPLSHYLEQNRKKKVDQISSEIENIVIATIAQLVMFGKYGITIPNDPRPFDLERSMERQAISYCLAYDPCVLCGETRITHDCHIIPKSEGGPDHRDNYLALCPLHHHLFDHFRLSRGEWQKLEIACSGKMEAAIIYNQEVRLPIQRTYWDKTGSFLHLRE